MSGSGVLPVRRALLSVANKAGLAELGGALEARGVRLVSSGTTASVLREAGVAVTPVSEVTGFPEMLEGRVKTLHPRIHAGILADKRKAEHLAQLNEQDIEAFDLVVVNLYPFRETVASGAAFDDVIEQIDIGGPALVRAAAKNFQSVAVVVDPAGYDALIRELDERGGISAETRQALARAAFEHTASYDGAISAWFAGHDAFGGGELPGAIDASFRRVATLRYGENPHQRGGLYAEASGNGPLGGAEVIQGK
jgi:phosphoribosylaminoimidazolecarboxamide formyltransferase / IMP cyclohydrolase